MFERLNIVTLTAWRLSKPKTIYAWPFLVATIGVWALAIVVGKRDPMRARKSMDKS